MTLFTRKMKSVPGTIFIAHAFRASSLSIVVFFLSCFITLNCSRSAGGSDRLTEKNREPDKEKMDCNQSCDTMYEECMGRINDAEKCGFARLDCLNICEKR